MSRQRQEVLHEFVRKLIRRGDVPHLTRVIAKTHPADMAAILLKLNDLEARHLLSVMTDPEQRAAVIQQLDPEVAVRVLDLLPTDQVSDILSEMDPDDAAGILDSMEDEKSQELLEGMEDEGSLSVEKLLQYEEETAGRIMTTEFLALHQETTAREALEAVRKAAMDMVSYTYVVDEHNHLLGVVSLRQLLMCAPDMPIRNILVPDVIRVLDTTDQEEVARIVAKYDFFAIPVVNAENQIVGIITVDDIVDVIKAEATEDILMLAGVQEEDLRVTHVMHSARARMLWLFVSLVGGLTASFIISGFDRIEHFVLLVPFIPIIAGMGGNVGTQTITIVVRGLATGAFEQSAWLDILRKELAVAAIIAVFFSGFVAAYAGWTQGWFLGPVVGLSLVAAILVSTLVAVCMPMLFVRMGVDPAVSSGPFVTTSIDILGITLYFSIAQIFFALFP